MRKIYFTNDEGNRFDTAYLDGYNVRDRILEGVLFKVTLNQEEGSMPTLTVALNDPNDEGYFRKNFMNTNEVLAAALEVAKEYDIFETGDDHSDLYLSYDGGEENYAYTFNELIQKFGDEDLKAEDATVSYVVTLQFTANRILELSDYDKIKDFTKTLGGVIKSSVTYDMTVIDLGDSNEA
jgi:hypothetical protein